jgi:hypothetical protein
VHPGSYQVEAGPSGSAGATVVYVADTDTPIAGMGHVVRYGDDGTVLGDWDFPWEVRAMDIPAPNQVWIAQVPELARAGFVTRYTDDGTPMIRWELPGLPLDLAVAPDGDIYVIVWDHIAQQYWLQRYRPNGCLVETWSQDRLAGFDPPMTPGPTQTPDCSHVVTLEATRTGTPGSGTPTATRTSTVDPNATHTTTPSATATESPPPVPTCECTATPTPTSAPGMPAIYLPWSGNSAAP